MTKEKRIKQEKDFLLGFFEDATEDKLAIVIPMIENAAFMRVTLDDLQKEVLSGGVVEHYQNGENQSGMKQSAALQAYNALLKSYTNVMKSLYNYMPVKLKKPVTNEKTEEELEAEQQAEEERIRRLNEKIAQAAEWQRQQREAEKAAALTC